MEWAFLAINWVFRERRIRMLADVLALSWTVVIVVILDLAAARIGNLRTTTAASGHCKAFTGSDESSAILEALTGSVGRLGGMCGRPSPRKRILVLMPLGRVQTCVRPVQRGTHGRWP